MHQIKAVIFDFIGTLTNVVDYDMENSKMKLAQAIIDAGFKTSKEEFLQAYSQAHEKYRAIRYEQLVEVTNAIWISEALNRLGFDTKPEDTKIKTAVNAFFEDYIETLELRPCAENLLKELAITYKLGLISNFTFAPVIYAGLKRLDINQYFNVILVSDETGWRKPNTKIFKEALRRLRVTAEETVYVGDSPQEDIKGAKAVGMKTVFVPSQFYTFENLSESKQKPGSTVKDLCELCKEIPKIVNIKNTRKSQ